jgi:hypothetical protein
MTGQSFALVLIAAIAALIAYLQWVTAHQKVVVDLFDRRRKAFELVEDSLRPVFRDAEVSQDAFIKLLEAKAHCRFLFGRDVNDYLDKLHADYAWLLSFTRETIDASPDRSNLIDQKYERLQRICAFYTDGAPLFVDYLRLDMKMRYFWSTPANPKIRDFLANRPNVLSFFDLLKRKWAEKRNKQN